jgi:hypothetical protein
MQAIEIPEHIRQRQPVPRLLEELTEASAAYVFGGTQAMMDTFSDLFSAKDVEEFEERLELLAQSNRFHARLEVPVATDLDREVAWTAVHPALVQALGGATPAFIFGEGIFLYGLRLQCAARVEEVLAASAPRPPGVLPQTPDPVIWSRFFAVDKGDACFVALLSLLGSRGSVPEWLGVCLADNFRNGQRAGVQVSASVFTDEEADRALAHAEVKRIDWLGAWQNACRVDAGFNKLYERWEDRTKRFSPYGIVDDDDDDAIACNDDDDDWKPVGDARV